MAGISFGHWVATKSLAAVVSKKKWIDASLEEATNNILGPFKSSGTGDPRYLHNGKFPCYCLYKTKDNKALAIAAVEDKFWSRFLELFELDLTMDSRFDTSDETFKIVGKRISALTSNKISELIQKEDICLTLV